MVLFATLMLSVKQGKTLTEKIAEERSREFFSTSLMSSVITSLIN